MTVRRMLLFVLLVVAACSDPDVATRNALAAAED